MLISSRDPELGLVEKSVPRQNMTGFFSFLQKLEVQAQKTGNARLIDNPAYPR
jgi:hypothetical protein